MQGRSRSFKQPYDKPFKPYDKAAGGAGWGGGWRMSYCWLHCAEAIQSQPLPISKELGILIMDKFTLQQMSRAPLNSICEGSKVAPWTFISRNVLS